MKKSMTVLLKGKNVGLIVDSDRKRVEQLLNQYIYLKKLKEAERQEQLLRRVGFSRKKSWPLFRRAFLLDFLFVFSKTHIQKKDSMDYLKFAHQSPPSSFLYTFSFRKHSFNLIASNFDLDVHSQIVDREHKFFLQTFHYYSHLRNDENQKAGGSPFKLSRKFRRRKTYRIIRDRSVPFWMRKKRKKLPYISTMAKEALAILKLFIPLWGERLLILCSQMIRPVGRYLDLRSFQYLPKQHNTLASLYLKVFLSLVVPFRKKRVYSKGQILGFIPFVEGLRSRYLSIMQYFYYNYKEHKNKYFYRSRILSKPKRRRRKAWKRRLARACFVNYRTFHKFRAKSLTSIERSRTVVKFFKHAKVLFFRLVGLEYSNDPFYKVMRVWRRRRIREFQTRAQKLELKLFTPENTLKRFNKLRTVFSRKARRAVLRLILNAPFFGERRRIHFNLALVLRKARIFADQNKSVFLSARKLFRLIRRSRTSRAAKLLFYMMRFPKEFSLIPLNLHKLFLSSLQFMFKPIRRSMYPDYVKQRLIRLRVAVKPVRLVYLPYRHKFHGFQAHVLDHKNNNLYSTWPGLVIKRISKVVGYNQAHKFLFLRTMKPKKAKRNWMAKKLTVRDASNFLYRYIRRRIVPTIEVIIKTTSPLSTRMGRLCLSPVTSEFSQRNDPWYFYIKHPWLNKNKKKVPLELNLRIIKLVYGFLSKLVRFRRFLVASILSITKYKNLLAQTFKVLRRFLTLAKTSLQINLVRVLMRGQLQYWNLPRRTRKHFRFRGGKGTWNLLMYRTNKKLLSKLRTYPKYKTYFPWWYKQKKGVPYDRYMAQWIWPKKTFTATSAMTCISKVSIQPRRSHGLPNKLRKSRRL